ncbi:MAG: sugar phosphate isomerase/epimerase [Methanomassiliicoccales archaeon]|nr:sugar phosphate isomerase/epimerase [Methanomassiliicoccales archaeon]
MSERPLLGIPTLIELPDFQRTVELALELKVDFIELNMNMPEFCPESLPAKEIRECRRRTGLDFTIHMPDDSDLASFHDPIREGHMARFGETARWAAEAGARLINLHLSPGIYFTLPDRRVWIYESYYDRFIGNLREAYGKVIGYARDFGVIVCTENVTNFNMPFVGKAIDDLCAMDGFYLTWDVGHDARTGYKEKDVLLRHSDRIRHMHLHDYNGTSDHQIPGTGNLDIAGHLRFAKDRGASVLIETKTLESLKESVRVVRAMLP